MRGRDALGFCILIALNVGYCIDHTHPANLKPSGATFNLEQSIMSVTACVTLPRLVSL